MLLPNRIFSVFRTSARGLEAQRLSMSAAAENIANATTTRGANGQPYAIKRTVQTAADKQDTFNNLLRKAEGPLNVSDPRHMTESNLNREPSGVESGPEVEVVQEARERLEYDPTHPHADANGYVHYPDVNVVEEMAYMISANRVYEANLSAIQSAKEIIKRTLEI